MSNPPTPRDGVGLSPRQRTPQLSSRSARGYQAGRFAAWGSQLTPRAPLCSDPVHVCIRMKPPQENTKSDDVIRYTIEQGCATPANTPRTPRNAVLSLTVKGPSENSVEEQRTYEFTDIFAPSTSDVAVERVVVPRVVDQVRQGYNAAVMCYGQTGSGKTYTVNALLPRLVESLFSMMESDECKEFAHIVKLSYIQIYNNGVYNLLTESKAELGEALPKPKGTIVAEPMVVVKSAAEILGAITAAQRRRAVAPHAMNARSSRSHTLMSLVIVKLVDGTAVQTSRLTVADLAGSERLKKTGVAGDGVDEAISINKSLSALARVIEAAGTQHGTVPIRDNVLTLYLAQSLQDSYMFLIATVATELCNIAETKSTLEFAMMARKCVVQRMKTSLGARDATFEEMQRQLNNEIQMLRLKVEDLQREAELERRRNAILQGRLEQHVASVGEVAVQEAHIRQLEADALNLSTLLREREDELRFLDKRRDAVETVSNDLCLREREKQEARETLASNLSRDISGDDVEALRAKLERANDAFLWQEEQLKDELEKNKLAEATVRALQAECHKVRSELIKSRQSALSWEKEASEARASADATGSQLADWQRRFDALEVQLYRERNDFKARQITIETYCSARSSSDELSRLDKALMEQSRLLDSVQARLTSCEQELFETDKLRADWESKAHAADRLYEELWSSLSAVEKVRFMRSDRQPSGATSFDVVALRNGLGRANQKCEELVATLRSRDAQIEELEVTVQQLAEARDERDKEFDTLRALEEAHSLRGEQLEQQMEALYGEIDAHCARREQLEAHLKETHAEWERLDHEYRESQKEIDALTNKLDESLQKLRQFEQSNDELTARLREAEEQKDSFKKRRDAEHARVIELERQLREQELRSIEVKLMRDVVAEKNRHIWRELTNSRARIDMFATRLEKIPGSSRANLKKRLLAQKSPSESFAVTAEPMSHGKQLAEQTKRRQLRFEVSQLRRPSGGAATPVAAEFRDPAGAPAQWKSPVATDTKRFSSQQKSPRGFNTRVSLVQQLAMQKQQAMDLQAVTERKQPPIPPLSLIQPRLKAEAPAVQQPPPVPPLSLGKRPVSQRKR